MGVTAHEVRDLILASQGDRLEDLPEEQGLYALLDHTGAMRYIGMTTMTIRRRVARYHVAGDGNSHKYSCAYNAGLLWHDRRDPRSDSADGRISKKARRDFARTTCRAIGVPLPGLTPASLARIEREVIGLVRHPDWNDSKSIDAMEVDDQVRVMTSMWSHRERMAMERQRERWMEGKSS